MNKNKPITTAKRIQRSAASFIELLGQRRRDEAEAPHIRWSDIYLDRVNTLERALQDVVSASPAEISSIYRQRKY